MERSNKALVAFVGTLGAGLTWSGSIFVNPLMSRAPSLQHISLAGAVLMTVAYALASLCERLWQLLLTQGLLYGIGSSLLYFPALSIAPEYFAEHRGAAMGIILSAAGFGGLVYAPLAQALLSRVGVAWTLRALALMNLVVGVAVVLAVPRQGRCATKRPTLVNVRIARQPAFVLQAGAALLQAAGNFVPMTFLPEFSIALGYSASVGALLLAVNNGVNSVSRIGMGVLADAVGRQNTLVLSVLMSAICVSGLWMAAVGGAKSIWLAFVILYGLWAGGESLEIILLTLLNFIFVGYNALFPTTITEVFGIQAYASVNGFAYFVRGLGALFGSPVGGVILGGEARSLEHFRNVVWYDAALLFGASLCVAGVRGFDAKEKHSWKWKA